MQVRSPWIEIAVNAISDKKGQDTLIIDVGDMLGISDNFVITSGMNSRQVRALVEEIEAQITNKSGPKPMRIEGNNEYRWVLMDYRDFVVHVFHTDEREHYKLEKLWADMPIEMV
tara:strand:- start:112 stop:456 length:345 start_codon:yes stop_codon:yes gene_type:complete